MKITNLCIIAGAGDLPVYALDEALKLKQQRNINFNVYLMDEGNKGLVEKLKSLDMDYRKISLGKFDDVIKKLKNDKISHALIVGKVNKKILFSGIKFNIKTLWLLRKIKDWNDKSLFNLVSDEFKKINVEILKQDVILKSLLCKPGVYSKKKPTKTEQADIDYGMDFARKIASLDIGQTVVVAGKTLLSVEAIEGTDEAIKRAGQYARNKSTVVCKAMRKKQDTRFDVPTVGLHTLETMRQSGCHILAIEANHTFVVDQESFFKKVNQYRMVFVSVDI